MLSRLLLVATLPFLVSTFPQNSNNAPTEVNQLSQADGFVFDGPTASRPPNGQQRTTSTTLTSTTLTSTTLTSTTTNAESTSTSTNINTTTPLPEVQFEQCVASCPVTMEYNPVCGTDNRDYTNPGGLGCAQTCGKDITLNYYGRCSTG